MLNNKLFILLVSMLTIMACASHFIGFTELKENFVGMADIGYKVVQEIPNRAGNGFVSVPGNYQGMLAPRCCPIGLGANITYNLPSAENMAFEPHNPLSMARDVGEQKLRENFDYAADSASAGFDAARDINKPLDVRTMLPQTDMTSGSTGIDEQVYSVDRFMYSNKKSRQWCTSDYIRGDLAITPTLHGCNNTSWFDVHPNLNIDLNAGALAVLGGAYNEQGQSVANMKMSAAAGADTAQGGIEWLSPKNTAVGKYVDTISRQSDISLSQGQNNVNVSAFP